MINLLRLAFMIVLLIGVALAAALLEPQWAQDLCLDSWTEVNLQSEWFAVHPRPGELAEQDRVLTKRRHAKDAIVKDLIADRLTLFEAAAGFRRLNEEYPLRVKVQPSPGTTAEEDLCRQVIAWVRVRLEAAPGEASEDFVARLEIELLRHKQPDGTVLLPVVFASH